MDDDGQDLRVGAGPMIRDYVHHDWFRMYDWCQRQLLNEEYEVDWTPLVRLVLLLAATATWVLIAWKAGDHTTLICLMVVYLIFILMRLITDYED